jgi:hypothetical protein
MQRLAAAEESTDRIEIQKVVLADLSGRNISQRRAGIVYFGHDASSFRRKQTAARGSD